MKIERGKPVTNINELLDKYGTMTFTEVVARLIGYIPNVCGISHQHTDCIPGQLFTLLGEMTADLETALKDASRKRRKP